MCGDKSTYTGRELRRCGKLVTGGAGICPVDPCFCPCCNGHLSRLEWGLLCHLISKRASICHRLVDFESEVSTSVFVKGGCSDDREKVGIFVCAERWREVEG